jgi:hypothetical protein
LAGSSLLVAVLEEGATGGGQVCGGGEEGGGVGEAGCVENGIEAWEEHGGNIY